MSEMTDEKEITAIIAEGELAILDHASDEKIAELVGDVSSSDEAFAYAILRVSRDTAGEVGALRGPVRVFASALTDTRVEKALRLVDDLTPSVEPPSPETVLQTRRNARLRAKFVAEWPTLTSEDVADRSGSKATTRAAAANRWRKEGRIFAVRYRGELRYPAFQFDDDGRPRLEVQSVLHAFSEAHASDWEVALWFVGHHPRAGRRPIDVLDDDPRALELLARQSLEIQQ
jgi:hypothetical protein